MPLPEWNPVKVLEDLDKVLLQDLERSGLRMVADLKQMIADSPGSGEVYPSRDNPNVEHHASAPGEPPAWDTGTYAKQFDHEVRKRLGGGAELRVGVHKTAEKQALALELGTRDGTLEPRPHFEVALRNEKPRLRRNMGRRRNQSGRR